MRNPRIESGAQTTIVPRVLSMWLVPRRALQYALARYSAVALTTVPLVAVLSYLYHHREESLQSLFSGERFLLLLSASAVGWLTLRYRGALLEAIDRCFFREHYDARQILTLLVERIRATHGVEELANLLCRETDLALHLKGISLMVLDPRSGILSDPKGSVRCLDTSLSLALLISSSSDPLSVDLENSRSILARLPEKERHWLVDSGFRLIVPILARDGSLLGIVGLGEKKSGLPFLREDRQLLHAVASSSAWVLELEKSQPFMPRHPRRELPLEHYRPVKRESKKSIHTPPGLHLRAFAELLFSRGTFELVLEPTLRDLYDEYCEALRVGRSRKAAWVRIRGYWSFWAAVVAQLPLSIMKKIHQLWKASW